jgi:hypothetical protein
MDDQARRDAINDADATGMVAGEELITEAQTLLPLLRPELPSEDLHKALPPEHGEHATIDRLHGEIRSAQPDRGAIESHVGRLRALPEVEAIIANWWDDPRVQRFVANLNQIGL